MNIKRLVALTLALTGILAMLASCKGGSSKPLLPNVSAKDLENIIRNYEGFDFKSIIVTKCDETTSFGRVISVLSEKNKPVSWITTGQDVLNTIQRADPKWFLKNLSGFKINAEHIEKKFGTADKETE